MGKVFKATFTNDAGDTFVDYLRDKNQASAYQSSGFTIEEIDESDIETKKAGRPRKETE